MKLLGHNDIKTTLRYLHVTNRDMLKIISPLDDLNL
jgi:site-specific recombinase XerD